MSSHAGSGAFACENAQSEQRPLEVRPRRFFNKVAGGYQISKLDVMHDVTMRTERVYARDGKFYKLCITPYRTVVNKIDGVVLTLLDISDVVETRPAATE